MVTLHPSKSYRVDGDMVTDAFGSAKWWRP